MKKGIFQIEIFQSTAIQIRSNKRIKSQKRRDNIIGNLVGYKKEKNQVSKERVKFDFKSFLVDLPQSRTDIL